MLRLLKRLCPLLVRLIQMYCFSLVPYPRTLVLQASEPFEALHRHIAARDVDMEPAEPSKEALPSVYVR